MKRYFLVLAALFCLTASRAKAEIIPDGFTHSITLATTGYTGEGPLENFPVLVRIKEYDSATGKGLLGFQYPEMTDPVAGSDLCFYDASGATVLPFQIDTWNENGESLVWVKLPSMTATTRFLMCYGTGGTVTPANPWGDYVGVWHLNETTDGITTVADATANALSGTTAASSAAVSGAPVGGARLVTTSAQAEPGIDSGITIDLADAAKQSAVNGLGTEFTASMWVRAKASLNYFYLIGRKNHDGYPAWGVQTQNKAAGDIRLYSAGTADSEVATPKLGVALGTLNQWHKIDVIWKSDGTYEIYQDGGNKLTGNLYNSTPAEQGALNLSLGGALENGNAKGGRGFYGDMDEVRLRAGTISADWAKADYDTVTNESFVTVPPPAVLDVVWSTATDSEGISKIAWDYVLVQGHVVDTGDAATCTIAGKFWLAEAGEPADWTPLTNGLVTADSFLIPVRNLTPGSVYQYSIQAAGNDGAETVLASGTFTTHGSADATTGSEDTHFFCDGVDAYYVVNDFERYLPLKVTGYTGTETLTNFPVLVDIRRSDTNGFTYDDFYRYNGHDMAFVDEAGHIIPHEIDTWNVSGTSLIWVRLPEMNNGTTFTMCYRSPLIDPPADPGNTFEPYIGVWHMNEKEDGVVDVIDSTTNNLIGETHAKSLAESNGRIGYARRVAQEGGASSSFGRIIIFDKNNILRDVGPVFTYSGWYKLKKDITDPDWAYLVSRKDEDDSTGWGIQYHDRVDSAKKMRVWAANEGKNKSCFFNI